MPRNRSTNTAALSTALQQIRKEISPIISVSSAPSHPRALVRTRDVWTRRRVRLQYGNITSAFQVKNGEIVAELGVSDTLQLKVIGVTVWNTTGPKNTTNYVFAETDATLTTNDVRCEAQDWGNGSSLPGVRLNIPDVLAQSNGAGPLQQTNCLFITGSPSTSTFDPQSFCVDVSILFNTSADQ